jgi:hypothetical protein
MSSSSFISLPGGPTLPAAVIELAIDLQQRGLHLTVEQGDVLFVGPRNRLTEEDRAGLRRWKLHLLALLAYEADAQQGVQ